MKTYMFSIHPEWVEKIISGEKTIEVRKKCPKTPFKLIGYETQSHKGRGQVIFEAIVDRVEDIESLIRPQYGSQINYYNIIGATLDKMCLTYNQLTAYGKYKPLKALHLTQVKVYDKPKELWNFFKPCGNCDKKGTARCTEEISYCRARKIQTAPQSYMEVEEVTE